LTRSKEDRKKSVEKIAVPKHISGARQKANGLKGGKTIGASPEAVRGRKESFGTLSRGLTERKERKKNSQWTARNPGKIYLKESAGGRVFS